MRRLWVIFANLFVWGKLIKVTKYERLGVIL